MSEALSFHRAFLRSKLVAGGVFSVGLALGVLSSARAANLSWDQTGGGGLGGTGTWDTTTTNWWNGASNVAWSDTTGATDIATFAGTAGTVTLGANLGALGLVFNTTGYTLALGANTLSLGTSGIDASTLTTGTTTISGGGGLTLGGAQSWTVGTGSTLAVSSIVGGSGPLAKAGAGTLTLSGVNTYSGGTTINGGILTAANGAALGTGSVTMQGGTLRVATADTIANNIVATSSGGTITVGTGANITLTGTLSGSGNLTLGGSGTNNNSVQIQFAANNMTGGTITLGSGLGTPRIKNTASTSSAVNWVFQNGSTEVGGTYNFGSFGGTGNFNAFNGNSSTTTLYSIGGANDATYSGVLSANGTGQVLSILKVGTNSQTFSGANSFAGATSTVTVRDGSLIAGRNALASANGAFGNSSSAIVLGDATTISSGTAMNPKLLTGGAFTIGRAITVGVDNSALGNAGTTFTIGGNTANISTFSGVTTLNQGLTVTQVTGGTLNLTGNITSGSSGTQTLTFNNAGSIAQSTGVIGDGTGTIAVTKSGGGTATLSGTNTYTGATTINGGTLALSGSGSINNSSGITINGSGAKLLQTSSVASTPAITLTQGTVDGTGTLGAVTVANSAGNVIQNGNGGTATLTLGGLAFNGAATLNIANSGTAATPGINVTGALSTTPGSGLVTINVTGSAWGAQTYNLLGYGSFSGSLSDFTQGTVSGLTSRQTASLGLDTTNKFITLTISGANPRWSGQDNGNWVVGSTGANSNWKLPPAGLPTDYIQGDVVYFNDLAEGTTTVDISAANVSPTAVIFDNSSKNYTLVSSGNFGIAGTGTLTKTGTGTATISTVNSYSGGTNINGGTLALSGSGTLGSGTVTLGGGTLDLSNGSSTVGAVAITAPATSGNVIQNGTLTPNSLTATNATGNAIVAANIAGSGGVTMSGTGTLTLSGTNTYTGGTTVGNGTLVLANGGSLSTSNTLTLGSATGDTSGIFQLGDSNGAVNTTVTSIATAGAGTANAVVGGNSAVSTLTVDTSGTVSYGGHFGGAGTDQNNVALVKNGTGTLTLSGASTHTGGTTLNAGTLVFANNAAFGAGTVTLNAGTLKADTSANWALPNAISVAGTSTFDLAGKNVGLSGNLSGSAALNLTNSGAPATLALSGDNSGYSGTITFNANNAVDFGSASAGSANAAWVFNDGNAGRVRVNVGNNTLNFGSLAGNGQMVNNTGGTTSTLSVGALNTSTTFTGTIKDAAGVFALTKVGGGTLTLSGASTYTGATTINGGTLRVNGSLLSTGTVGFSSTGATLAGTGTVGDVTLSAGNFLAPGDGTNPIGTLTVNSLTLNGGHFTFDLSGVDSNSDMILVNNALTDGGTGYTFDFSGGLVGETYTLMSFSSTTFTDASKFSSTGASGTFTLNGSSLSFTATSVVPEPGVVALLVMGLGGVMLTARRKRHLG